MRACFFFFFFFCPAVQCSVLNKIQYGEIYPQRLSYQHMDVVNFNCTKGYSRIGNQTLQCTSRGVWSGRPPRCEPGVCPLGNFENGKIDGTNKVNQNVTFSCDRGYNLVGEQTLMCLPSQDWSRRLPLCQIVSCGEPPVFPNMTHNTSEFTFNTRATYVCAYGYINGSGEQTCNEAGNWSGQVTLCSPFYCGTNFTPPAYSHNTTAVDLKSLFGTIINFDCDPGYEKTSGNANAVCDFSKRGWIESTLVCTSKLVLAMVWGRGLFTNLS